MGSNLVVVSDFITKNKQTNFVLKVCLLLMVQEQVKWNIFDRFMNY